MLRVVAPLPANGTLVRLPPDRHLLPVPVTALLPSRTGRCARQRMTRTAGRTIPIPTIKRGLMPN
ncbi:hypothetical protein [Burkholderia metallica]|uniref:hypothetical protein n=1 Tax=Burkholderia metallica TaxID=488729 RepID=UPI0014533924|nr:LysR family transcriptional regulator [Burkholderia metallica]